MPPKHVLNIKSKSLRKVTRSDIDNAYTAVMQYMQANAHSGLYHPDVQKVLRQLLFDFVSGNYTKLPISRKGWAIPDCQYSGMAMVWLTRKVGVLRRLLKRAPKDVVLKWYREVSQCNGTV